MKEASHTKNCMIVFFSARHFMVTFRTLIQYFFASTRQCRIAPDKVDIIKKYSPTATILLVGILSLPWLVTK